MTPIVLVVPQDRRVRPWHRWSNWCVTVPPAHSTTPRRERETGRHCFKWYAELIAGAVELSMKPDRLGITQHIDTRRTIKRAER